MNVHKILKIIGGLVLTVFVGALGSGVWEKVLSPLLQYTSFEISSVLSRVSTSYSDSIYLSAATYPGIAVNGNLLLLTILLIVFIIWMLHDRVSIILERGTINNRPIIGILNGVNEVLHRLYKGWLGIAYALVILISVLIGTSKQTESVRIQRESLTKLEIVRPTIGEQRYVQLRSQYFSMKNEQDYIAFLKALYYFENSPNTAASNPMNK